MKMSERVRPTKAMLLLLPFTGETIPSNHTTQQNVRGLLTKSTSVPGGPSGRRRGRKSVSPSAPPLPGAPAGRGRRGGAPSALGPVPPSGRGRRGNRCSPSSPTGRGRRGGLGPPSALLSNDPPPRRSPAGGRAVGSANISSLVPGVCETMRCNISGRVSRNTPPCRLLEPLKVRRAPPVCGGRCCCCCPSPLALPPALGRGGP